jgi:type I restriction enzyme M protein
MTQKQTTKEMISAVLWRACDSFRGKIDSQLYKDYILVMLFLKYLSDTHQEHLTTYKGKYNGDMRMVELMLKRDRFILDESCTYERLYKQRNANNIGEIINKILERIEEDNKTKLRGVFRNIDFNSESIFGKTKDRNAMLKNVIEEIETLDLRPSVLGQSEVLGDAYEYMIANFASDSGKKGGEFFTPSEVSELIARLVKPRENDRIYDPTCGSGSLLIRTAKQVPGNKVQLYGQERNGQTYALSLMNMFLHKFDDAKIEWGDTLSEPKHLEKDELMTFDVEVANPPFSLDKWAIGFSGETDYKKFTMRPDLDPYHRFDLGVPPKSKGDYAFVLHMLKSLAENGRMGIVLPHGVLFRGASEGKIRKQILKMNLLDCVIGLPSNLFFGTGIPAAILIFKKNRDRKNILFIDASQDGMYQKGKNQNKLREEDLQRIVDAYDKYETQDKFTYVATPEEIKENDYNLNIPRYVDTFEEEEPVDIEAVLKEEAEIKEELAAVEAKMADYLSQLGISD